MKNIVVFASGAGSNAENIANYFFDSKEVSVLAFLTNNGGAFVNERAKKMNIPCLVFNRDDFYRSQKIVDYLKSLNVDLIVLAGFLWLLPSSLLNAFPNRIINIHPALLPKYGGKGMYGRKVHEAVVANGEKQTGITIHMVNEEYDKGKVVLQVSCDLESTDTVDDVERKIHALEFEHFPIAIKKVLSVL